MKINFKKIGRVSLSIVEAVYPAVKAVEESVKKVKEAKGSAAKQQEAFDLIKAGQALALEIKGSKVMDNPRVAAATKVLIDAVVALQNVLNEELPADEAPAPEAPAADAPAAPAV